MLRSGLELLSVALGFGWRQAFTLPFWRLSYSLCSSSLSFGHPQRSVGVGVSLGVSSLLLLFFWVPADTLCHFCSAVRLPACYHWGVGIFGLCWTSLAGPWAFLFRYLNPGCKIVSGLTIIIIVGISTVGGRPSSTPGAGSTWFCFPTVSYSRPASVRSKGYLHGTTSAPEACDVWMRSAY
jgi:hypothetical protein